mmetsp:Transcript_1178/g.3333  ORF Transcript_1178/g.3333 Transcript_1178/m.3333 type:complete len:228 (-) Transcript_1178:2492-3175(-)
MAATAPRAGLGPGATAATGAAAGGAPVADTICTATVWWLGLTTRPPAAPLLPPGAAPAPEAATAAPVSSARMMARALASSWSAGTSRATVLTTLSATSFTRAASCSLAGALHLTPASSITPTITRNSSTFCGLMTICRPSSRCTTAPTRASDSCTRPWPWIRVVSLTGHITMGLPSMWSMGMVLRRMNSDTTSSLEMALAKAGGSSPAAVNRCRRWLPCSTKMRDSH